MKRQRVLMVLSRPFTENPTSGREKINSFIFSTISSTADVNVLHFRHFFITRNIAGVISALFQFLFLLFHKPCPLQALLFNDSDEILRVCNTVKDFAPNTVYVEGVRSFFLLKRLRDLYPNLYIVCDFDDLMSNRMQEWQNHGNTIAFGYIDRYLPKLIKKLVSGPVSALVCNYEKRSLRIIEREALNIANKVVLLSSCEYSLYKQSMPESLGDKILCIPPACDPLPVLKPAQPIRFVFIGSDALLQNSLSIKYLVDLWQRHEPSSCLYIYGKITREYDYIPAKIHMCGFVDSLNEVYTKNSVLLSPAFVKGGVKTKVLEAMEFGILTVGNCISFEGIVDSIRFPILDNENLMIDFIKNPHKHLDQYVSDAREIAACVSNSHSSAVVKSLWLQCLLL